MVLAVDTSPEHWIAVLCVAAVAGGATLAVRRHPGPWVTPSLVGLGVLALGSEATWWVYQVATGTWSVVNAGLPLHLCDAATLLAAAALWWRRRVLVELLYFWACAGTVQALLTPWLPERFPHLLYFQYYAGHGAIVVAALVLVVGLRMPPGPGAVPRALLLTAVFTALAGAVDWWSGANYMYLRQPPPIPSLLDVMGPWPWYLLTGAGLAVALFALLYAPFWARRRTAGWGASPAARTIDG